MNWILIACGGALGACLRAGISLLVFKPGISFPYATLIVNIAGSFLIGVFFVLIAEKSSLSQEWRMAVMIGVLGAMTTFSTFSLETLQLAESGRVLAAGLNTLLNVILSLAACYAGLLITRLL